MKKGKVHLVGAGPGDEGLITVRGLEAIRKADVILYDRLINPVLLESAPSHCELIYCGKLPHKHLLKQEMINDLLIQKALAGHSVVRLKGGDPGVFGRVGEEAAALAAYGIPFELVPGVTSGIAAPLYAGIPVTHREYGVSFAVVTAHDKSAGGKPAIHWAGLVKSIDTIAFYMGVGNISHISENLILHGKRPDTPVILIQWGTYGRQETLQGTLADIAQKVAETGFRNPAITLVGDIVSIREKLKWFEKKPLYGKQILLARTGAEKSPLAGALKEQGADVIEFPKWISKEAAADEQILQQIFIYDRILFSAKECIAEFLDLLRERKIDIRNVRGELFCLSNEALELLKNRGLTGSLKSEMNNEGKLLIITNRIDELAGILNPDLNCDVLHTSGRYIDQRFIPVMEQMLMEAAVNTVIFPSGASVDAVMENAWKYGHIPKNLLGKSRILCLGESTWKHAVGLGLKAEYIQAGSISDLICALTNNEAAAGII